MRAEEVDTGGPSGILRLFDSADSAQDDTRIREQTGT
jgi:hypothetical protein